MAGLERSGEGEEGEVSQWRWVGQKGEGQWCSLKDLGSKHRRGVVLLSMDMLQGKERRHSCDVCQL